MTRITARLSALLLVSTAAFAQTAFAQTAPGAGGQDGAALTPGAQFVTIWDQDGDGTVTLDEALIRRGNIFAAFDADENGVFSATEWADLDALRALEQQMMQDQREAAGMGKEKGKAKGKEKDHDKKGKGKHDPLGLGWDRPAAQERAGLDRNGDGQIDQNEFLDGTPRWFKRMDRNDDGVITAADFGHS